MGTAAWAQVHCFSYRSGKQAFPPHLTGVETEAQLGRGPRGIAQNSWGGCAAV